MNLTRLEAEIRDKPRFCTCPPSCWMWRKREQRWVRIGCGRECPVHVPAVPR